MKKVVFCIPTLTKPHRATMDALSASTPLLDHHGWDHSLVSEVGCPYVSHARATMLRKALDAKADVIVFIDHDVSWDPADLLTLIETDGDVVAGTYRFKREPEEYMGALIPGIDGTPIVREDGCVKAHSAPAGFLKITRNAVNRFIKHFPDLCYGEQSAPHVDLFNHGAHGGIWYGEDFAFCRRWLELGGEIWTPPDMNIHHHSGDIVYRGNLHEFLLRQPGGSKS